MTANPDSLTDPIDPTRADRARLALLTIAWAAASALIAIGGAISPERPFVVPLGIVGGVGALALAHARSPRFRAAVSSIDRRVLVAYHVVRAPIGVAFLVMLARGELPSLFAERAGWGDILAGGLALAVLPFASAADGWRRRALLAWNVIGLADILLVVATAQYLVFIARDPLIYSLAAFPMAMLPTFVVPLVIATHLALFVPPARAAS